MLRSRSENVSYHDELLNELKAELEKKGISFRDISRDGAGADLEIYANGKRILVEVKRQRKGYFSTLKMTERNVVSRFYGFNGLKILVGTFHPSVRSAIRLERLNIKRLTFDVEDAKTLARIIASKLVEYIRNVLSFSFYRVFEWVSVLLPADLLTEGVRWRVRVFRRRVQGLVWSVGARLFELFTSVGWFKPAGWIAIHIL